MNAKEKFQALVGTSHNTQVNSSVKVTYHSNTGDSAVNEYVYNPSFTTGDYQVGKPVWIAPYTPQHIEPNINDYTGGWQKGHYEYKPLELDDLKNYRELIKNLPNKVDKEIVDTKIPYNIKKDYKDNLIYEICCAGFSKEEIKLSTEDNKLLLSAKIDDEDDLIGDDFEFLCYGIKNEIKAEFFIDFDMYDKLKMKTELHRGILRIILPLKKSAKEILTITEIEEDS